MRKKKVVTESFIRYKLYEAAIETGMSSRQYHLLMNEGVLDWVKDALNSVSAGKEMAGDIKKMFADKKNQVVYSKASEQIQKAVAELFAAGAAAGVDKAALKDWLVAGINKMTEEQATAAPEADKEAAAAGDGTKPGTPVDAGKPEQAVPTLAAAAAEASGQDPEKGKEQATEKKVDVPKATKVLAAAISKQSGAKPDVAEKVIGWLVQNSHLMAESGLRVSAGDLLRAAKMSMNRYSNSNLVMERWQKLAGVKLLKEEGDKKDNAKKEEAKKKFGDLLDDVLKGIGMKQEDEAAMSVVDILIALDDLEAVQIK